MSEKQREIKWMAPFGPIIMETMITEQVHEILVNRADQLRNGTHPNSDINTETNDYRSKLAGCLSEEYSYAGAFSPKEEMIVEEENILENER